MGGQRIHRHAGGLVRDRCEPDTDDHRRIDDHKGFVVLPKRWIVERTFEQVMGLLAERRATGGWGQLLNCREIWPAVPSPSHTSPTRLRAISHSSHSDCAASSSACNSSTRCGPPAPAPPAAPAPTASGSRTPSPWRHRTYLTHPGTMSDQHKPSPTLGFEKPSQSSDGCYPGRFRCREHARHGAA